MCEVYMYSVHVHVKEMKWLSYCYHNLPGTLCTSMPFTPATLWMLNGYHINYYVHIHGAVRQPYIYFSRFDLAALYLDCLPIEDVVVSLSRLFLRCFSWWESVTSSPPCCSLWAVADVSIMNGSMCTGWAESILDCSWLVDCCWTMPLAHESMEEGRGSVGGEEGVKK